MPLDSDINTSPAYDAVSLDLETMGTDPGDAILSIGMVRFNTLTGVQDPDVFYCSFSGDEAIALGYKFRDSTMAWWSDPKQADAREYLYRNRMPLIAGLQAALDFIRASDLSGGLWSRGYMDETMLKLVIREQLHIEDPWHYRAANDARTLLTLIEQLDPVGQKFVHEGITFIGTPHYALDDAIHEAKLVHSALNGFRAIFANDLLEPKLEFDYHALAMRTAAGPEVYHVPTDPDERSAMSLDLLANLFGFLRSAAILDNAKSVLFYGKPKPVPTVDAIRDRIEADIGDLFHRPFDIINIPNPQIAHAILGLATEGAELVEDLIKLLCGADLDAIRPNMRRESGDIEWYQELLAEATGDPVETNRRENIERLQKRFPDKFSEADALERKDEQTPAQEFLGKVALAPNGNAIDLEKLDKVVKQSSPELSSLASKVLGLTLRDSVVYNELLHDAKRLAGSVLSQDETPGNG